MGVPDRISRWRSGDSGPSALPAPRSAQLSPTLSSPCAVPGVRSVLARVCLLPAVASANDVVKDRPRGPASAPTSKRRDVKLTHDPGAQQFLESRPVAHLATA